jgi:hypothetical protein
MVFGSIGEASTARPHKIHTLSKRGYEPSSTVTTPRTPFTTTSRDKIPDHLHAEFLEWMRERHVSIGAPRGGFLTPQPRRLTDLQIQRRQDISDAARRQRTSLLHSRRSTSQDAPSNTAGDTQQERTIERAAQDRAYRGPLTFPEPLNHTS